MIKVVVAALALTAPQVGWASELDGLKAQLASDDDQKAAEAATKLGESKDGKALDAILDALSVGTSPHVQAALLGDLTGRKDARSLAVVEHYAKNRNPELRKKAVEVLAALPGDDGKKVVPVLIDALSDSVEEVRAQAALSLGKRKERSAEPKLLKLMQHKDEAAAKALAQMGTPELAHRISEMLGQIPDALYCVSLGDMLKRPDFGPEPIRVEIVRALNKVPGVDSTSALIEYVAATEKDKMRPSRVEAQKIVDQRSSQ
jgi:HEAT repeats